MESLRDKLKVDVPEGESGNWKIERFTVSHDEAGLDRVRSIFAFGGGGRYVPEGTYTRLMRGRSVIMSDTPDELRDHYEPIRLAQGHCLVNGLGLGVVLNGMAMKEEVKSVTVIEKSDDVIALVANHYHNLYPGKIQIIPADALLWKPPKGVKYNVVWHDIWDNICTDNLPDMHKLHRKYGRRTAWQGSWARGLCEAQHRRDKRDAWRWRR